MYLLTCNIAGNIIQLIPAFSQTFLFQLFLFKCKRNSWDVEVFKFHLAVRQQKGLENSSSIEYDI